MTGWQAIGAFLTSPGFGGLGVLVAGVLAFRAAGRTAEVNREAEKGRAHDALQDRVDERETQRQQRWWESVQWIYTEATRSPESRMRPGVALQMFRRMAEQAQTEVEKQVIRGILETFTDRRPGT